MLYKGAVEEGTGGAAYLAWDTALNLLGDTCCAGGRAILAINRGMFTATNTPQVDVHLSESAKHMSDDGQRDPVFEPTLARTECGTLLLSEALRAGVATRLSDFSADWPQDRIEHVAAAAKLVDEPKSRAVLYFPRERRAGTMSVSPMK